MKKVFITGISGCIGHYVFDVLKNENLHLYLLVRNPKKLRFDPNAFPNVTIINDHLGNIEKHAALLKEMDYCIHLAAQWGGKEVNYDLTLSLFNLLDPGRCVKVIYFSTASILGPDNQPLEEAERFGTGYIQGKYRFHKKLPELKIYPRVISLFPTWVLGGDSKHPYSHALSGILRMRKWLWLLRFFRADVSFHFIHAQDAALIAKYLLENDTKEKEYVLGNAPLTASEFLRKTCGFFNQRMFLQIPIPLSIVRFLSFIMRHKFHPWDRYCLQKKHFIYKTTNAASFGIKSNLETVEQVLHAAL
jgi:nucleoside-diphosphate-sugar epimerase